MFVSSFLSVRHPNREQHSPLDFAALKSPITAGFARKTSALRRAGRDLKFSLLGRISPNLPTARIWYGTRKRLILNRFW
jgi:hypothetical protein